MRQFVWVPIALMSLAVPVAVLAGSGEGGFDGVVHSIEGRYHVRATKIPFMGLMSLVASKSTHGGVRNLHVAEIESFTEKIDGDELDRLVEEKLGAGWERMIRDTSRHGEQQSLIFIRPEGDRMGLFIVDKDGNELDVVQVSVDPKHLDDDIGKYTHHQDKSGDGKDSNQIEESD